MSLSLKHALENIGFFLPLCVAALLFSSCQDRKIPWMGGLYTGKISHDVPQGFGQLQKENSCYIGEWTNGKPDGFGKYLHQDTCYEGHFVQGKWEGQGKLTVSNGVFEGEWKNGFLHGKGSYTDSLHVWSGTWKNGKPVYGTRRDADGIYTGAFNDSLAPSGYGKLADRDRLRIYSGYWNQGKPHQFGIQIESGENIRIGWWRNGRYLGEKMTYNTSRVYGIDISRYQHKRRLVRKGRRRYWVESPIEWDKLRITHLGAKHNKNVVGSIDFPVSFCFIKSTQGVRIRSKFYASDAHNARKRGIKVGAYHFMSPVSGKAQARWFLRNTHILQDDLPPVLDVELTAQQIAKMGGKTALYREIQAWMDEVERASGKRPILYVSQQFIEKYLHNGPAKLLSYNVWIARYGEYRPYVKLLYWQLSPFGRVKGIYGEVDINVFNGSKEQFEQYVGSGFADIL